VSLLSVIAWEASRNTIRKPVSSPKWHACFAREGISRTPTTAGRSLVGHGAVRIPLRQLSQRNILEEAKRGLAANTQRSHEVLSHHVPSNFARVIRYGRGLMNWGLERDGGIAYRLYWFMKD
jgi:hypothetical protein